MKAAIYYGPEQIRCTEIPDAAVKADHEILVKVIGTSICGSDLHLYRGAFDHVMEKGKLQTGHELVGEVVDVGKAISRFRRGERVSMAYSSSCGQCYMCEVGQTTHCETTRKATYGYGLNGTHAEAIVIPYAETHTLKLPSNISDAAALTLSCNLPSAVIANYLADIRPGESVAIVGGGPTGLMTLDIALHRAPGRLVLLDKLAYRLAAARDKGATAIDVGEQDWKEAAAAESGGRGFDKVIEVVGYPETLQMCLDIVRPGGVVTAIGVFTDTKFNLNLANVFRRNITLHMQGATNVQPYMWESLRLLERDVVRPQQYFSHTFALADIDKAFAAFDQKTDLAMKMMIRP